MKSTCQHEEFKYVSQPGNISIRGSLKKHTSNRNPRMIYTIQHYQWNVTQFSCRIKLDIEIIEYTCISITSCSISFHTLYLIISIIVYQITLKLP